jgi:hypothetical protein
MFELRKTSEIARGEIILLINDQDAQVITEFLGSAHKKGILNFITLGDLNDITKLAADMDKKGLTPVIVAKKTKPDIKLPEDIEIKQEPRTKEEIKQ